MSQLRSLANDTVGWLVGTGILLAVVGGFAIYAPLAAGLAADTTLGVLLVIGGIAHFVLAWKLRGIGGSLWETLIGIAYILGGVLLFAYPVHGLLALTGVLAVYLFLSAVTELLAYYNLRFLRGSGWLLFDSIVSFILAILILRHYPDSAAWVPGTLVGCAMLASGLSRILLAFMSKQAANELTA